MQNGRLAEFQFPKPLLSTKKNPSLISAHSVARAVGLPTTGGHGARSEEVSGRKRGRFWTAMGGGREQVCLGVGEREREREREAGRQAGSGIK